MRVIRATEMRLCESPARDILAEQSYHVACASIAGVTLELRTNVPGLAAAFAQRFAEHAQTAAIDFTYFVRQDSNGYVLWCDHDRAWRWDGLLPLDAVLFLTEAAAMSSLVHYDGSLASMHAAGVAYEGVAAAIAADSTGGKTTTALACARAGMQVYSDERVLLRGDVVHPFLRRCRVREGGARLLNIDAGEFAWRDLIGERVAASPATLGALFVIAGKGPCAHAEPVETASALQAVARWFDCKGDALERMAHCVRAVRGAQCFALTLGSPEDTAAKIRSVLQGRLAA